MAPSHKNEFPKPPKRKVAQHSDIDEISLAHEPAPLTKRFFSRTISRIISLVAIQNTVATLITLFVLNSASTSGDHLTFIALLPTLVLATLASGVALFMARQIRQFPGASIAAYFPFCLALSFMSIAFLVVILRLDYSRVALITSIAGALLWLLIDYFQTRRKPPLLVLVIPGGKMRDIREIKIIACHYLKTPSDHLPNADLIAVDLHHNHHPSWERYIAKCVLSGIPVFDVKGLIESLTGRVEIEHLSENNFGAVLPSNLYLRVKYLIDFIFAVLVLLPVILILAIAVIAIRLDSPGPVFFRQPRIGFRAQHFTILKLRSMTSSESGGSAFTKSGDQRITRVGRFIRKYRIDELPQIFNILRGQMSWIGPRPEAVALGEWYAQEIPYYIYRHAVRPGLSGWAQVNQGNVAEIEAATRKLHYDFYYIKNFSPLLDLTIALRTVYVFLTGFGSI